ncbi:MAG: ATP-binding cassette domain-containing protein [Ilumatobacteraceae bacterium]|nr:ATP-binding cassette domain-containing protein [Ilumatobacteraceae bacterium]
MYEPSSETSAAGAGSIVANDLTKRFGQRTVVDGLSFEVRPGEIFGVLGRNGSGKSTTVRMLTTLLAPSSGSATVAGFDVVAQPRRVRSSIGVTLQDATVDPNMTGRQHLRLVGRLLGNRSAAVGRRSDELLEQFGLSAAADRPIHSYSGGMQRRLDIATALFDEPPVLFLDEPTTGLDPQSRRALWTQIRDLQARGTTLFLTTQYLEEADQLADRIVVLDAGTIIAEGSPADLKHTHGHRTITIRGDHADALGGLPPGLSVTSAGDRTTIEGSAAADVEVALVAIRDAVGHLDGLTVSETSLEDVFIQLTGHDINTPDRASDAGVAA